ncbi:hypothetical protein [Agrobacterium sp. MA01]|uniref:hypothetical protein n=1 Tax=Agrobacterium sp. MA01 TaxID=2664893 RepID=UPI001891D0BE|nr:hypothetical protein [Agrobacterium sp. MA01]
MIAGSIVSRGQKDLGSLPLWEAVPLASRHFSADITELFLPQSHILHTYYDVDPISPSGRFLLVTRIPFIWRLPLPGDVAQICVVDLHNHTITAVYNTYGWGAQTGANAQWGADDNTILFNDVLDNLGTGVRLDLSERRSVRLGGTIGGLSPDRRFSYGTRIELINGAHHGYGVPESLFRPYRNSARAFNERNLWRTNLLSGETEIITTADEIVAQLPREEQLENGIPYIFNVRVSPKHNRLMIALFSKGVKGRVGWPMQLVTCGLDGSDVALPVPDVLWKRGGHHANWHPSGTDIVMNLNFEGKGIRFVQFNDTGAEMRDIGHGRRGSGHPTVSPSGRFLLTDAYNTDGFSDSEKRIPLRLIDLESGDEKEITRLSTMNLSGDRRIDPHPVWSRHGKVIVANSVFEKRRSVILVDISESCFE